MYVSHTFLEPTYPSEKRMSFMGEFLEVEEKNRIERQVEHLNK